MHNLIALILIFSIALHIPLSGAASLPLKAGAAAVDVTPKEFPMNMPGGFSAKAASKAHDPLYSRAIVLDDGTTTLAIVVLDNLGAGPDVLNEAKQIASAQTGIPAERMLVCSTHTHTGPSASSKSTVPSVMAYHSVLVDGLAQSIIRAKAATKPATIGFATIPIPDEVFNRRWYLKPGKMPPNPFGKEDAVKTNPGTSADIIERPAGPTDPTFSVFSIQDVKRKHIAVFANYALHYVGGSPDGEMSADYFGEFARLMPSRLRADHDFVAMLSNGASGDINNIPFGINRPPREPFEQIRIVAQKAADAAWKAIQSIPKNQPEIRLGMRERDITLQYRKPSAEMLEDARKVAAVRDKETIEKLPRLAKNYAGNVIAASERAENSITVKLQAIRVGDVGICGIPFETFVEIGLELKKRSPLPQTVVVGLANGRHGYLPTPDHHALGGYETWLGTNVVQEDASVIITDALLEMLGELNAE